MDSKYRVVQDFYRAFNSRDLELMKLNWSQSESILMANPIGGIRRGRDEIFNGYAKIFGSEPSVYVELFDFQFEASESMFVINGRERGHLVSGKHKVDLRIRTTRIYRLEGASWKQIVHHGSIDEPDLLNTYQQIILGR